MAEEKSINPLSFPKAPIPSSTAITKASHISTNIAMNRTLIKHQKTKNSDNNLEQSILIPGLPNHLAQLCLTTLPPSLLSAVCRPWRRLIYSPSFPPYFSLYALFSTKNINQNVSNSIEFFSLDPISSAWNPLPPPPSNPSLHLLHRHPSFISRNLPIQSITVSGHLVLIAATNHHLLPAVSHPIVFNPLSSKWFLGPPLTAPRRWCITASANGAVYVASGVGPHYQSDVARSVEKWDMKNNKNKEWKWERMEALKDGRFSREAIEAVGYKGKLYMVNVKGNSTKQGAVYDILTDRWEEMPAGMLAGWNGPAGVEDEKVMYVVEEEKGILRKYDPDNDCWEEVVESMEHLKGAEHLAVGRGRVCVVCANGGSAAVVDVVARPVKIRVVNFPAEKEVVAVHILPRMSVPENL